MTQDTTGAPDPNATPPAGAEDQATPPAPPMFDPTEHTAKDVVAYLETADADEQARVIAAERDRADGKDVRATVAGWKPKADEPPAEPATVRPKRYAEGEGYGLGQFAPEPRYGRIDSTGRVTATDGGGSAEPSPGERGVIIVQAGDVVTRSIRAQLGLTD